MQLTPEAIGRDQSQLHRSILALKSLVLLGEQSCQIQIAILGGFIMIPAKTFFIAALCGVAVSALPFDLGNVSFGTSGAYAKNGGNGGGNGNGNGGGGGGNGNGGRSKANRPQLAGGGGEERWRCRQRFGWKCAEIGIFGKEKSTAAKVAARAPQNSGKAGVKACGNSRSPRCRRSRLHPRRKT